MPGKGIPYHSFINCHLIHTPAYIHLAADFQRVSEERQTWDHSYSQLRGLMLRPSRATCPTHHGQRAASCYFGLKRSQSIWDLKSVYRGLPGKRNIRSRMRDVWGGRVKIKGGDRWMCSLHDVFTVDQAHGENQSEACNGPEKLAGPSLNPYLRLRGSSVMPFPFRLGWKEQKLNKKGKNDSISRVKTLLPPGRHFWCQVRGWVHSCPFPAIMPPGCVHQTSEAPPRHPLALHTRP